MTAITRSQFLAGLAGIGGVAAIGLNRAEGDEPALDARGTALTRAQKARLVGYFPNVALVTHNDERVRLYDDLIKGKFVVFNLMYTWCDDICPLTTANLIAAKEALGDRVGRDVFFYGLTLDPVLDTPAVLRDYARSIGAGRGYTFLTGALSDIDLVRRKLGLFDPDPVIDADKSSHGGLAIYGNEPLGRWCGLPALVRPERIVHRLRRVMEMPA